MKPEDFSETTEMMETPMRGQTLHNYLVSRMVHHGNKISQVDPVTGETLTFDDLRAGATTLSDDLGSRGLRHGSVAMIIAENSVHFPWVLLGVQQTGATPHLVNPRHTKREFSYAMSLSRPHVVLVSAALSGSSELAAALEGPDAESVRHVLVFGQLGLGVVEDLGEPRGAAPHSPAPVQEQLLHADVAGRTENNAVALILSSSGTTGMPKGVMLTNHGLLSSLRIGPLGELMQYRPSDVVTGMLPFYHAFGVLANLSALDEGVPVVQVTKFPGVAGLIALMKRHGCSLLCVVPSLLATLAEHPSFSRAELPALRVVETGGTALLPPLQAEVRRRLPGVLLLQAYGMTEACVTLLHAEALPSKQGFAGLPSQGYQYKLVDPATGEEVPEGRTGELCVRGPTIMKGYLSNSADTSATVDAEGWLHTGDATFVDSDGYYFIVDRLKFIFKYNGNQVSPAELEMLLCSHPAVREAAVTGVPHKYGEAPMAVVVLAEGAATTAISLQLFIEELVEPHKRLRGGVHFVQSLPRNLSGKVQRDHLPRLLQKNTRSRSQQSIIVATRALETDGRSA